MTAGELHEELAMCKTVRRCECLLALASQEGDEGRRCREDLQSAFQREMQAPADIRRVGGLLTCLLLGVEGDLSLLDAGDDMIMSVHCCLAIWLGAAVRASASRFVRRLLELGASPTVTKQIFGALFHDAVGNEDILRQLLAKDDVGRHELDHNGNSPLLLAVRGGHVPSVELLLTAGVDTGVRAEVDLGYCYDDAEGADDWAALDVAASVGRADICMLLVEGGADVNASSEACSRTPLHAAAGRNQVGAIDALIKLGANVEGDPASSRDTPVDIAAKTASLEAIAALAGHGAALNSALHRAVTHSELKVVVALLEAGADANESNSEGETPLHGAARWWPREEISRTLLRHGARIDATDNVGRTPLHVAASDGFEWNDTRSAVEFFAEEAGAAGLGWRDQDGSTPLHVACKARGVGYVTTLLRRGADIAAQDHDGNSPLHLAVASKDVVGALLLEGADAGAVNIVGSTALHLACTSRSGDAVAALVRHDPTLVNAQNLNGDTPLHAAAAAAEEEGPAPFWQAPDCAQAPKMVDLLLRAGADESVANTDGHVPLRAPIQRFIEHGRLEPSEATVFVLFLLLRAPADRAWRRRGLLLMCRAFSETVQLEEEGSRDKVAKVCGDADGDSDGRHVADSPAGLAGDLTSLVARLFDLPEEGVFRKIICFL
eukprot:g8687.t1